MLPSIWNSLWIQRCRIHFWIQILSLLCERYQLRYLQWKTTFFEAKNYRRLSVCFSNKTFGNCFDKSGSRIACQKNPNCNFWSYNPSLKHCLTFETFDVIEKSHQGYISGSRCCPTEHKVKPEYCQAPDPDSTTPKVGIKLISHLWKLFDSK